MNRFFVEPEKLGGPTVELDGEIAHQVARVLRLEAGDHIALLDNLGYEYEVELTELRRQGKNEVAVGRILDKHRAPGEPRVQITLYQALLKGEKFDYVLQKSTEVGVTAIVPLLTERCVSQGVRTDRWRKIVREAAEQSRRGRIPELPDGALRLPEALARLQAEGTTALMAWEEEHALSLKQLPAGLERLAVIVGPEGGLTEKEAAMAQAAGIKTVTLGPRILRAETAGPIVTALALYQLGEME